MGEKKMTGFPSREEALRDFLMAWTPSRFTELVTLDCAVGRVTASKTISTSLRPLHERCD